MKMSHKVPQLLSPSAVFNIYCTIEEITETPLVRGCKGEVYNL